MTTEVPKPTVGDRAHALAKAGLSMFPVAVQIKGVRVEWCLLKLFRVTMATDLVTRQRSWFYQ